MDSLDVVIKVDSQQTFKSGINQMVRSALNSGGVSSLRSCITTVDGIQIRFDVSVSISSGSQTSWEQRPQTEQENGG